MWTFGKSLICFILGLFRGLKGVFWLIISQLKDFFANISRFLLDKDLDDFVNYFLTDEQKKKLRDRRIKDEKRRRRLRNLNKTIKSYKRKVLYYKKSSSKFKSKAKAAKISKLTKVVKIFKAKSKPFKRFNLKTKPFKSDSFAKKEKIARKKSKKAALKEYAKKEYNKSSYKKSGKH